MAQAEEAYVQYLGGGLYAYEGVPADVFEQLANADSKGTFVNAAIKPCYPVRRQPQPVGQCHALSPQRVSDGKSQAKCGHCQ